MSTRQQIIANALRQRYRDVCQTASQPVPDALGEKTAFVSHLRKRLAAAAEESRFATWDAPETWFEGSRDCLTAIRALAADEPLECITVQAPEESDFFQTLQDSAKDPQRRFELLTTRYRHPLNIAAPSERRIREHLLERLMVADRPRIERKDLHLINSDDLLLRLNLLALAASFTNDLRYLDALNYYYELRPLPWSPESTHNWLSLSFVAFYARALAVHFSHVK